jgi:hypothetical protein
MTTLTVSDDSTSTTNEVAVIAEFLTKAEENLHDAEAAVEAGRYNAAANRAYYAAFQAAIAALADANIKHEKNPHAWVQAQFCERLIKARKHYPSHLVSYLSFLQKVRDKADYQTFMTSKQTAKEQVRKSKESEVTLEQKWVRFHTSFVSVVIQQKLLAML